MNAFTQVSLETIFYKPHPFSFWESILFLLCLWTILLFSLRISLKWSIVFYASSHIILISHWIEPYLLYLCNKYRALFNYSYRHLCFYIFCCAWNKAICVAIVILRTSFWSVRAITLFWNCWINPSFYTTLSFCSFSSLDFNYFIFVRVCCAFVEALYLLLQVWDASCLSFAPILQA